MHAHRTAEELSEIMCVQQTAQDMANRRWLLSVSPSPQLTEVSRGFSK